MGIKLPLLLPYSPRSALLVYVNLALNDYATKKQSLVTLLGEYKAV